MIIGTRLLLSFLLMVKKVIIRYYELVSRYLYFVLTIVILQQRTLIILIKNH